MGPEKTKANNEKPAEELKTLLSEVDERIRFSLDIDSTHASHQLKQSPALNSQQQQTLHTNAFSDSSHTRTLSPPHDGKRKEQQVAQVMKNDLSKVKEDLNELKNELSVARHGLAIGKQPIMVSYDEPFQSFQTIRT